jgi:histone H3/H4
LSTKPYFFFAGYRKKTDRMAAGTSTKKASSKKAPEKATKPKDTSGAGKKKSKGKAAAAKPPRLAKVEAHDFLTGASVRRLRARAGVQRMAGPAVAFTIGLGGEFLRLLTRTAAIPADMMHHTTISERDVDLAGAAMGLRIFGEEPKKKKKNNKKKQEEEAAAAAAPADAAAADDGTAVTANEEQQEQEEAAETGEADS